MNAHRKILSRLSLSLSLYFSLSHSLSLSLSLGTERSGAFRDGAPVRGIGPRPGYRDKPAAGAVRVCTVPVRRQALGKLEALPAARSESGAEPG